MQIFNRTMLINVKNMQRILFNPRASAVFLFGIALFFTAIFSTIYPILTIILSLATVVLLLFVLKMELSYYLLLLLLHASSIMFISYIHIKTHLITLGEIFLLMVCLLWCFSRTINFASPYSKTSCDVPIFLFVSLSILSFLWSED